MRKIAAVTGLLVLAGCATATATYLPDGRKGHSLNCSGAALNWGMCETKAGEICREKGYDVVSAQQDGAPFAYGTATASSGALIAGANVNRTMLIACK